MRCKRRKGSGCERESESGSDDALYFLHSKELKRASALVMEFAGYYMKGGGRTGSSFRNDR